MCSHYLNLYKEHPILNNLIKSSIIFLSNGLVKSRRRDFIHIDDNCWESMGCSHVSECRVLRSGSLYYITVTYVEIACEAKVILHLQLKIVCLLIMLVIASL